jgi:hypothetical protein
MIVTVEDEEERAMLERWRDLATKANEAFAGQPMEDVGGALALLTAMLMAGLLQGEGTDKVKLKAVAMQLVAQHGTMVINLIPSYLETIDAMGGWANVGKKERH